MFMAQSDAPDRRHARTPTGRRIRDALAAVEDLGCRSVERDTLWLVLWKTVTTRSAVWVSPTGSSARVRVTAEDADAELIAAWDWLEANEQRARRMTSDELYRALRGAATGSHRGSARAAIADRLCGLTRVPGGTWIDIGGNDDTDRLAS